MGRAAGHRDRAGIGGLVAALLSAAHGFDTLVLERAPAPGGKMRELEIEGRRIDAGPTVFTMRDVFEDLFASAGASLGDHLKLKRAGVLARHAWADGSRLDLFGDVEANAQAIGAFAGARGGARLSRIRGAQRAHSRHARTRLSCAPRGPTRCRSRRASACSMSPRLMAISPFETLWEALGAHFQDPRLRQLFGALCDLLRLLAVSRAGDADAGRRGRARGRLVCRGRHAPARRRAANRRRTRAARASVFGAEVERLVVEGGRVRGVETRSGERFAADAVVFNGDVSALGAGLLGARGAAAALGDAAVAALAVGGHFRRRRRSQRLSADSPQRVFWRRLRAGIRRHLPPRPPARRSRRSMSAPATARTRRSRTAKNDCLCSSMRRPGPRSGRGDKVMRSGGDRWVAD